MTPSHATRSTVLVVEDDLAVLACYRRLLERAGYRTRVEADPLRVIGDSGAATEADLVLLDYKMPGLDGLSLLAALRRRGCRARCILVSAYLNDAVRHQARNLGVDRILEKPVDVGLLRAALDDLLPVADGPAFRAGGAC